jgi:tetratricopeptide (TPR) repeat protein
LAYFNRGLLYGNKGNYKGALNDFEQYISKAPEILMLTSITGKLYVSPVMPARDVNILKRLISAV